jgi:L-asparaginase/beta-aspartyl-peptidase (threonine type)
VTSGNAVKSKPIWALAIHGGAGSSTGKSDKKAEAYMTDVLNHGGVLLRTGEPVCEVVANVVHELEASGLFLAGKGAAPNEDGAWELDAAIMDGETRNAGAVACLEGFRHPIDVAEKVMTQSSNVLLVGDGAAKFAKKHKCKRVKKPSEYFSPAKSNNFDADRDVITGTVGAVALDLEGRLAAATSTGGAPGKKAGAVGDTPLIGAGTWADERVAISCTGMGEHFIRANVASDVSARIHYQRKCLDESTKAVLEEVVFMGGQGGLIGIDRLGRIAMPFTTPVMRRGFIHSSGKFEVATS